MSTFSLRIPDDLMEEAKKLARENHTSLNQFLLATIAEKVGEARTRKYFEQRAQFANVEEVKSIMDRVPEKTK